MAVAPTKNISRFEWFLEKATEIGISRIIPMLSEHSERKEIKHKRLEKVITSAMKQSLKAWHPVLDEMTTFKEIGIEIEWKGKGVDEVGVVRSYEGRSNSKKLLVSNDDNHLKEGAVIVEIDPRYFRPTDVEYLQGDATKAKKELGWEPKITFNEMVSQMVKTDLEDASMDQLCRESGYKTMNFIDE